jgi:hypothetical protein
MKEERVPKKALLGFMEGRGPVGSPEDLPALVHRSRFLCDKGSLHDEQAFLKSTSKENGYSQKQIYQALNPPTPNETLTSLAFCPTPR